MPEPREDDLFQNSTMTFGEHLGELRGCLLRSIYGLLVGFVIGLALGDHIVAFIQRPLLQALKTYYQQESVDRLEREIEKLQQSGRAAPWTQREIEDRVLRQNLLADEVYVDVAQLIDALKTADPERFKDLPSPAPQAGSSAAPGGEHLGLVRLFLWHRGADDPRMQSKGLSVFEGFAVYVKASLLFGILVASPWIFYQIWQFVAAGLYPHERRYVHLYLPFSIVLFLLGAALAFFVVFGPVLDFLLSFNRSMLIGPEPRINEWLSFVWILPVGFGIGFQLPLVMLFLERIGVFTIHSYLAQWRIAVLVIVVVAGILMPPDPYSMLFNAGAMTLLYFGGILLCKLLPRRTSPFGEIKQDGARSLVP